MSISERSVRLKDIIRPTHRILGQHTIHLLPHSSAAFHLGSNARYASKQAGRHSASRDDSQDGSRDFMKATQRSPPAASPPSISRSSDPAGSDSANPSCFCLDAANVKAELSLPVLFTNAEPHLLSYSITPLEGARIEEQQIVNVTIPKNDLVRISGEHSAVHAREDRLDLELEDADGEDSIDQSSAIRQSEAAVEKDLVRKGDRSLLKPEKAAATEMIYNLPIRGVGRIRLERVMDRSLYDVRLSRSEVVVVECPRLGFIGQGASDAGRPSKSQSGMRHYCPEEPGEVDVWVKGTAPLELRYRRKRLSPSSLPEEQFTISHISASNQGQSSSRDEDESDTSAAVGKGHRGRGRAAFGAFSPTNVTLPITLDTSLIGKRSYVLEEVSDACGNTFEVGSKADANHIRGVNVHTRPIITFEGCGQQKPIELLQGGPAKNLAVKVSGGEAEEEGPFEAMVKFEGTNGQQWTRTISFAQRQTSLVVEQPGTYTLEAVQGSYCAGEVGATWTCAAIELPRPTAKISFDPIQDKCAGPVGVKALAELSGAPPFRVKYHVKRQGKPTEEYEQRIERTREEIEFRPTTEGEVTYTFRSLSDANYKDMPLDGPTFTQILHPIASASIEGAQHGKTPVVTVHSCEGNLAKAKVHLSGVGPFELAYAIRTSSGELLETRRVKDIKTSPHPLDIQVPQDVAERGGPLTVSLLSVRDDKGCERPLTMPDLVIDVRRTKPTVAFVEPRESTMLEGSEAKLPLRLAGDGPWTVKYSRPLDKLPPTEVRFNRPDANLIVNKPGVYRIVEVRDAHCPGVIVPERGVHMVYSKPRPLAYFETGTMSTRKGIIQRPPVCAGTPDETDLRLQGHYPISITYRHRFPAGETREHTFSSAQNVTSFRLSTDVEGKHTYELERVGDIVYAPAVLASPSSSMIHRLEQMVYPLPTATYAASPQSKRVSLCLGESISGDDRRAMLPTVSLGGTPPFTLEFAIKDAMGAIRKQLVRRGITTHEYKLDVDASEFRFDNTGKWGVELTRVVDGNGCERAVGGATEAETRAAYRRTLDVEIAEAANISPVGTRDDYCVGESIEFVLQGSPPWSVTYDFEGHKSRATVKTRTFSRVAERQGVMRIEAVSHQQNKCSTPVASGGGMVKTIHDLPYVHIREGSHYIEDLQEGNQAEIIFKLKGDPPFSFTYQRKQAVDRYSRPQVLETHTVAGIQGHTYTITTSEEGTWSVIWLQDKWCAVSIDMGSGRSTSLGEAR